MSMATKQKSSTRAKKESPTGEELLVIELQEIYSAESQLARVLPRLSKAIQSEALRAMMDERLKEGETILNDIETSLDEIEETPGRKKNIAAEGLIADAREHVQEIQTGPALDAVLTGAIQKTEHYCIAAWGTAKALAAATGQKSAVRAMDRALKEGGRFDERLTALAERELTPALLAIESDDEDSQPPTGGQRSSRKNERSEART
jgi:ferritin-like metal-binding protein YciE